MTFTLVAFEVFTLNHCEFCGENRASLRVKNGALFVEGKYYCRSCFGLEWWSDESKVVRLFEEVKNGTP